jgi:hypothetical protein
LVIGNILAMFQSTAFADFTAFPRYKHAGRHFFLLWRLFSHSDHAPYCQPRWSSGFHFRCLHLRGLIQVLPELPPGSAKIFLLITKSRTALGPIQPPVQWKPGFFLGVKWPARKANHSPLSSVEIMKSGAIPPQLPDILSRYAAF